MRSHASGQFTEQLREFSARRLAEFLGVVSVVTAGTLTLSLVSWSARDPSFNHATSGHVRNLLGPPGAVVSDLLMQLVGFGAIAAIVPIATQGLRLIRRRRIGRAFLRIGLWTVGVFATAATASLLPATDRWPLPTGLGGVAGDAILAVPRTIFAGSGVMMAIFGVGAALLAILAVTGAAGLGFESEADMRSRSSEEDVAIRPGVDDDDDEGGEPGMALISLGALIHFGLALKAWAARGFGGLEPGAAEAEHFVFDRGRSILGRRSAGPVDDDHHLAQSTLGIARQEGAQAAAIEGLEVLGQLVSARRPFGEQSQQCMTQAHGTHANRSHLTCRDRHMHSSTCKY